MGVYALSMVIDIRGMSAERGRSEARRSFNCLETGSVVEVISNDAAVDSAVADWAAMVGHELLDHTSDASTYRVVLRHR